MSATPLHISLGGNWISGVRDTYLCLRDYAEAYYCRFVTLRYALILLPITLRQRLEVDTRPIRESTIGHHSFCDTSAPVDNMLNEFWKVFLPFPYALKCSVKDVSPSPARRELHLLPPIEHHSRTSRGDLVTPPPFCASFIHERVFRPTICV